MENSPEVYGAPSTGVPICALEDRAIRLERREYSARLMYELLGTLTPIEAAMKSGVGSDYDYAAFSAEDRIFDRGNIVHVLRHLRYDRHKTHSHGFFEVICQAVGRGKAIVSGTEIELESGTICILAPGTEHRIELFSDDGVTFKIIMRKTDFDEIYRQLLRSDTLLSGFFGGALYGEGGWLLFDASKDEEIIDLLLRLRYHEVRRAPTDAMMKEALLMQLFCRLADRHISNVKTQVNDTIGRMLSRIQADFRTITLSELAEEFHFTGGYISRRLKKATGSSFIELVQKTRLEHSKRLLAETELSISQIAVESGFGCRECFHRQFRDAFKMTPSAWRERSVDPAFKGA